MDIFDEYQNKKLKLKNDINDLINIFQENTGCVLTQLEIKYLTHGTFGKPIESSMIVDFIINTNIDCD